MKRQKNPSGVVSTVQEQTSQAQHLARIPGQDRLTDPRTNPAVRPHADRLRDVQHRRFLDASHSRVLRGIRVEDRRASHAEKALEALQEARETSSPAKSVLALHAGRSRYMRVSLGLSVALAFGSARGLEHLAEAHHIPAGSGYISEIGLTGLATIVILARSDLTQHGGKIKGWHDAVLWALMTGPLVVSMAANVYGKNIIGALCAAGAAAFSLFSYVIAEAFADSARDEAEKVTDDNETNLRKIAAGDDMFAVPTTSTGSEHNDEGGHKPTAPVPMATDDSDHKPVDTPVPAPVTTSVPTGEHKPSDHSARVTTPEHTPVPTSEHSVQPTGEVATAKPMATTPAVPTPTPKPEPAESAEAARKSAAKKPAVKRRSRDQIRAELEAALKEHFENGGGEPQVQPLANKINVNRRIVRELLDDMNVRPMIRKAV